MAKIKIMIICVCLIAFTGMPIIVAADSQREPSFQANLGPGKHFSDSHLDSALSNHSLDQAGHGLLVLAIVTFLALRKR